MTTAQQIIEAAYSRSTANDPGKLATDNELLGRLNRTWQGLWALAARQRPDAFAGAGTLTLTGAGLVASVALAADYVEVRRLSVQSATFMAVGAEVHLIPASEINRQYHIAPCVYQLGSALFSRGKPGDPLPGDVLAAQLILAATTLAALSTALDAPFPTRHHELFINDLALYLDAKDEDRDPEQFKKLAADQSVKLAAFAQEYDLAASALEFMHNPVERVDAKEGGA